MSETCVSDSFGRERECGESVERWKDEAFSVISKATDPSVTFLIDIKNICDTKKQCGCFLRGVPTRYKPTCFNQLLSVDSAKMVVLVNSGVVHEKYDTDLFPAAETFSRGMVISRNADSGYDVISAQDPSRGLRGVSQEAAASMFDFVVRKLGGIVGYEFEATVSTGDSVAYSALLESMVLPDGNPVCAFRENVCALQIDPADLSPQWDIHVTLDDRLVWHIAESCSFYFDSPTTAKVRIGVLSSNVPPFVL